MKSGIYLSSIFTIWIVAFIVAYILLTPDIFNSLESIKQLENFEIQSSQQEKPLTSQQLVEYTPLSVFEKLGL